MELRMLVDLKWRVRQQDEMAAKKSIAVLGSINRRPYPQPGLLCSQQNKEGGGKLDQAEPCAKQLMTRG